MNDAPVETIRIEIANRWDALDLAQRLRGYRLHLVQLSDSRWFVCVRQDRDLEDLVREVHDAATQWASERSAPAVMRLAEQEYQLLPLQGQERGSSSSATRAGSPARFSTTQ